MQTTGPCSARIHREGALQRVRDSGTLLSDSYRQGHGNF